MAEGTKIQWADHTFNGWIGCTKVSPGCKNCYAETWAIRKPKWQDTWGPQGTRLRTSRANWRKPITWNRKVARGWEKNKVFSGSLCDVFEDRPELEEWRTDLFNLIERTPHLKWLLLTKRPENVNQMAADYGADCAWLGWSGAVPRNNIWIGTSVEDQEQADIRIPELLKVWDENVVKFLSVEPMLGPISLRLDECWLPEDHYSLEERLDWVIVGGESGPNRRPMDLDWARDIRDQCKAAGVPYFFKQVDKVQPIPDDLNIMEFPE